MTSFLSTVIITFGLFAAAVLVINFAKNRTSRGNHELTGMCHRSGGASCCSGMTDLCEKKDS